MFILQMEHPVPDFAGWKKAFDSDPLNRKSSGVKNHRIFRVMDNPNHVVIELEFDSLKEAENMHERLKQLWKQVDGKVIFSPQSRIFELTENVEYNK